MVSAREVIKAGTHNLSPRTKNCAVALINSYLGKQEESLSSFAYLNDSSATLFMTLQASMATHSPSVTACVCHCLLHQPNGFSRQDGVQVIFVRAIAMTKISFIK